MRWVEDKTKATKSYDTIKLGIDAHAKWYEVARQLDAACFSPMGTRSMILAATDSCSVFSFA